MTDEMAKRLRGLVGMQVGDVPVMIHEAADHIDALADRMAKDAKAHEKEIAVWSENYAAQCAKRAECEARLLEVEAKCHHWETVAIARHAKQNRAEAALVAAYRLGVEAATDCIGHITRTEDFDAIRALPDPTFEQLMARIKEVKDNG